MNCDNCNKKITRTKIKLINGEVEASKLCNKCFVGGHKGMDKKCEHCGKEMNEEEYDLSGGHCSIECQVM